MTVKLKAKTPTIGHGEERGAQVGRGPDVPQPLANLALGPLHARLGVELGAAHEREGDDDGGVRGRVDEEARGDAQSEDQDAADGRADDAGRVHDTLLRLTALGRRSMPDHLGDERLPGRIVEQVDHAEQRRQRAKTSPQVDRVGDHQQAQREGQEPGRGLGGVEHLALVEPVGDRAHRRGPAGDIGRNWRLVAMATSSPVP